MDTANIGSSRCARINTAAAKIAEFTTVTSARQTNTGSEAIRSINGNPIKEQIQAPISTMPARRVVAITERIETPLNISSSAEDLFAAISIEKFGAFALTQLMPTMEIALKMVIAKPSLPASAGPKLRKINGVNKFKMK